MTLESAVNANARKTCKTTWITTAQYCQQQNDKHAADKHWKCASTELQAWFPLRCKMQMKMRSMQQLNLNISHFRLSHTESHHFADVVVDCHMYFSCF